MTDMPTQNRQQLSPVWTHLTDIIVERAEGCYLYDAAGNRYLDFTSGIGVTNTGHCHPKVVKAVQDQAAELMHFAGTDFYYAIQRPAAVYRFRREVLRERPAPGVGLPGLRTSG